MAEIGRPFVVRGALLALCVFLLSASAAKAQDVDADPLNALIEAIHTADTASVRGVINETPEAARAATADGTTALHWAARMDRTDVARLLVEVGADVDARNRYGVTPLALACTNGSAVMIRLLVGAGADPNGATPEGETVLMTAARTGAVAALQALLDNGADVNAREGWRGQTALMWAAVEGHVDASRLLLAAGAEVNTRSFGGRAPATRRYFEPDEPETEASTELTGLTPLHFAVREGHDRVVRLLTEAGADVNAATPDGTSPMALAVINAHYAVAGYLLEQGADPNASDPRGSILHALSWMRRPGSGRPPLPTGELDSLTLARQLLEQGADPNARIAWQEIRFDVDLGSVRGPRNISVGRNYLSFIGATPFYLAAKHADVAYMRLLVEHGADPLLSTDQGVTPLMVASGLGFWDGESPGPPNGVSEEERLEAVEYALALGNDLNARADFGETELEGDGVTLLLRHPFNLGQFGEDAWGDMRWNGSTALHGAAVMGSSIITEFLIEQGAEIDAQNALGWTPLMVAEGVFVANTQKHWPETAALLRQLGARPGPRPQP